MAIEPGVPCSCNKHTREGRYNLDPDIKFFATPPHHGSLAQVRRHTQVFLQQVERCDAAGLRTQGSMHASSAAAGRLRPCSPMLTTVAHAACTPAPCSTSTTRRASATSCRRG